MLKEFKEFALKGNMFDLAIGTIIGAAFGGVVGSFVKDLIMAAVGGLLKLDFSKLVIPLDPAFAGKNWKELQDAGAPYIGIGNFLTVFLNFLILALVLFMVVKAYNAAKKKLAAEEAAAPPAGPTTEEKLLTEIRDLLKSK